MSVSLERLESLGLVGGVDAQFARALSRRGGDETPDVLLAAALASRQVAAGHVCVDLTRVGELDVLDAASARIDGSELRELSWPPIDAWRTQLADSPLVAAAPGEGAARPLVLDGAGRLYLRRYWRYQEQLAHGLRMRAEAAPPHPLDEARLEALADALFPAATASAQPPPRTEAETPMAGDSDPQMSLFSAAPSVTAAIDWQREAALTAVRRRLVVISGGPGTGKTYTVVKLLALLAAHERACGRRAPRALLLAPTGKAAARMLESMLSLRASAELSPLLSQLLPDALEDALPREAATIHRALGLQPDRSRRARHGPGRPLPADLVIVDEASMVDLSLMEKLVSAVAPEARLVLLGDPDQLSSVEAGAVLGDLCRAARGPGAPAALRASVVELRESRRYDAERGIGALAQAVRAGEVARALAVLDDPKQPEVALIEPGLETGPGGSLREAVCEGYAPLAAGEGLDALERYRVLCALRRGPFGLERLNRAIARWLLDVDPEPEAPPLGTPILVTRNDPELGVFNGDTGLVVADEEAPAALFPPLADNAAGGGAPRRIGLARLPEFEPCFALSVHKSQGSEFDRVDLVLPVQSSPILTRELVYTAVTRARSSVRIFASRAILAEALARGVVRSSGLVDALIRAPLAP